MRAMEAVLSSVHHLGIPAVTVNQYGRISDWNEHASLFFRLSDEAAIGSEWHTVVRSTRTSSCCALCQTRHSLRHGNVVRPVETTLDTAGYRRQVVLVPVPATAELESDISFLIMDSTLSTSLQPAGKASPSDQSRVRQLEDDRMIDELTMRERDILACVVDGLDARGIAGQLGISHATARNYVQRILTKLGVRNKAEAVGVALTYNLLAS